MTDDGAEFAILRERVRWTPFGVFCAIALILMNGAVLWFRVVPQFTEGLLIAPARELVDLGYLLVWNGLLVIGIYCGRRRDLIVFRSGDDRS